jgi:hypothetical protein
LASIFLANFFEKIPSKISAKTAAKFGSKKPAKKFKDFLFTNKILFLRCAPLKKIVFKK